MRLKCLAILCVPAPLLFAAGAQAQTVQPGRWQVRITVTSFDAPEAPPVIAQALKLPRTFTRCVTPAEAAQGPMALLRDRGPCKFARRIVDGGRIDAALVCDRPDGATTATITGTFSATSFSMNTAVAATGRHTMRLTSLTTGERVGPCQ